MMIPNISRNKYNPFNINGYISINDNLYHFEYYKIEIRSSIDPIYNSLSSYAPDTTSETLVHFQNIRKEKKKNFINDLNNMNEVFVYPDNDSRCYHLTYISNFIIENDYYSDSITLKILCDKVDATNNSQLKNIIRLKKLKKILGYVENINQ